MVYRILYATNSSFIIEINEFLRSRMSYMKGKEDKEVIHRDSSRKHTFAINDRVDILKKYSFNVINEL